MNPAATPQTADPRTPVRRRRRWYVAAAIVCGLLPMLLLEAGLRLADVGGETTYQDPLVGFSRLAPLFERDEQAGVYRTARSRQVLFGLQQFAIEKPAGGIRIFCLGGSTVRGRPYTTETAFARWLQLELSARDSDHTYEVVNCGGLSYASYRLTHILQEVLACEPDLIVIATGHNEFLEDRTYADLKRRSAVRTWLEDRLHQLRTVQLVRQWAGREAATDDQKQRTVLPELVEARLDQVSGYASYHRDDAWAAGVRDHFDQSLRTMVAMCRAADVPAVLVLLGSNVRDCPPFKSEHRPGLTLEEERTWQQHFEETQVLEESDPQQALALYESAVEIDDQHALLQFRTARLLDRLGRFDEAAGHYLAAKDEDVCPLRMPESLAETLQAVAEQTHTPLVNARGLIEAQSENGLPGNDWYRDHVHPGIGAHQLIADALVEATDDTLPAISLADWSDADRRHLYREHLKSLGPIYLTNGYERVSWLEKWARRQRLLEETLPRDPAAHLRYGDRLWDFARQDEAWQHYRTALDADPPASQSLLQRCDRLYEQGRTSEARQLLDRLAADPHAPSDEVLATCRARYSPGIE